MQDLIGQSIGRYQIIKHLGEGGMAVVYLAEDMTLHRQVAIKMIRLGQIPPDQLPRMLERFSRETKALVRLSDNPGIVTVYDYGEYQDMPYLVMSFLPGGTLKDMLGKPIDYRKAAGMLIPVTRALGQAHKQGIIHRDVKPSNLLVDKQGNLALADFGIAKTLDMEGQTLTSTGTGVGTPEYMAPEQWRGKAISQTDVYSLGVVFYEMVTGRKPFQAETPSDVYLMQMTESPIPPRQFVPGLPNAVEDVLFQTMHREARQRFADMDAFREALQVLALGVSMNDEFSTLLPHLVVRPNLDQLDTEVTCDELPTSPPTGEIKDSPKISAARSKTNIPKVGLRRQRKWWLASIGVVVVLGLTWGIVSGMQGNGLMAGLATKTATSTATMEATATKTATATNSPTETPIPTETPVPTPTLGVGSTMISEKDGMVMVYVPSGDFAMGSDKDNDGKKLTMYLYSGVPQIVPSIAENVVFSESKSKYLDSYWIDQTEVTNAMYELCVNAGVCEEPRYQYSNTHKLYYGNPEYINYPVILVTWDNAKAYCEWAGKRLPSEAEWEKAARGVDGRTFPWGEEIDKRFANYYGYFGDTTEVGSFPDGVSPYGAYDMAGNVLEWVSDGYKKSAFEDVNFVKGGAWNSTLEKYLRTMHRGAASSTYMGQNLGFRCVSSDVDS